VAAFFVNYNKSRGKKFKIRGKCGPKEAAKLLDQAIEAYRRKHQ
jgi:inorganic pyrophosphatase